MLFTESGGISLEGESTFLILPAVYLGFMALPLSGLFHSLPGSQNRKVLIGAAVVLGIVGLLGFTVAPVFRNVFFLGILIYTFGANWFMGRS